MAGFFQVPVVSQTTLVGQTLEATFSLPLAQFSSDQQLNSSPSQMGNGLSPAWLVTNEHKLNISAIS